MWFYVVDTNVFYSTFSDFFYIFVTFFKVFFSYFERFLHLW